jgi:hypothetical protein
MAISKVQVDAPTSDNNTDHGVMFPDEHIIVNKVKRVKFNGEWQDQLDNDGRKQYTPSFMDKTTDLDYQFPSVISGTKVLAIAKEKALNEEPFVIPEVVPTTYVLAFAPVKWDAIVNEATSEETQPKLLVATYKPLRVVKPTKVRL